jgi:A/G-specific adenine glycosylase
MKSKNQENKFKKTIWDFYKKNRREFPWRETHDPYKILVSEIMLQQTQTARVVPKYKSWLKKFPTLKALALAPTRSVLLEWQGLGYNRRALALKRVAEIITQEYKGKFPTDYQKILALPGIGHYTAGAVLAFAFFIPIPVIETNIRTVFIHFFFKRKKNVHDKDILSLVEKTLDQNNPRNWYYALMDYGVYLKEQGLTHGTRSAHYVKQSPFKGSNRELRSHILRYIGTHKKVSEKSIINTMKQDPIKVKENLKKLSEEGFLKKKGNLYSI